MSMACIAVFSLLVINNALFIHTHKTEAGKLFSHAHPFSKSTHSHSADEIYFYDNLQLLSHQEISNLLPDIYLVLEQVIHAPATRVVLGEIVGVFDGRAPPAC